MSPKRRSGGGIGFVLLTLAFAFLIVSAGKAFISKNDCGVAPKHWDVAHLEWVCEAPNLP